MTVKGTTVKIVAEYDGQVDRAEAIGIAKEAVLALEDVYRVTVETEDGSRAYAKASFVPDDDLMRSTKVVTDFGWEA